MKKEIIYDELLKKVPNKYILTLICGQRARAIAKEKAENNGTMKPLTKYDKKDTYIKKVFREVLDGRIDYEKE